MFNNKLHYILSSIISITFLFQYKSALAQVIPDNTLNLEERSIVTPTNINNVPSEQVQGGAIRGSSLFHSFQEFNVSEGRGVYFRNPSGIENILTRVTGSRPSNILGTLGVLGSANLFFINPNGIIFGSNARLDLGGSFLASTADSIKLSNSFEFGTRDPKPVPPLLTINIPTGLQLGINPASIKVEGNGHSLISTEISNPILEASQNLSGLTTLPGKTIALIGGDVDFNGGILSAQSGRIEVGGVADGVVSINSIPTGINLTYDRAIKLQNIELRNRSLLNTSSFFNGDIFLYAGKISLTSGSTIISSNFGDSNTSRISINAKEALKLNGSINFDTTQQNFVSGIISQNFSSGKGADIYIKSNWVEIQGGEQLVTKAYSGFGGDINVELESPIQFSGEQIPEMRVISSLVANLAFSDSQAGSLKVSTGKLSVRDGASLASETFGTGAGGTVNINAFDTTVISGAIPLTPDSFLPSFVGSLTAYSGQAGNVLINTNKLLVENGGRLDSSTLGLGAGGNIIVNATESIDVIGSPPGILNPTFITSSATTSNPFFTQAFNLLTPLSGLSGNISLNTNRLNIQNNAQVSVRNDGSGNAGKLEVNANIITLDSYGSITATSSSGESGNIFLQAQDIQLDNSSSIATDATGGTGNGGNIAINTDLLTAFNNSGITAKAVEGRGGNIKINTQGLFRSPDSSISASSQRGINGTVQINNFVANPSSGAIELPTQPLNVGNLIAQGCPANVGKNTNSFIVTGRGGLPESPYEPLSERTIWEDQRPVETTSRSTQQSRIKVLTPQTENSILDRSEPEALIEANSWTFNSKGEPVLVASASSDNLDVPWLRSASCKTF